MVSGFRGYLQARPATVVAGVFALYALLFTLHSINAWRLMVQGAEDYLLEDVERRALEMEYLIQRFSEDSAMHAESYEIQAFLQNRDLGMSMRYGLGSSLQAVEYHFRNHLNEHTAQRILYFDEKGELLVDTGSPRTVSASVVERVAQGREGVWVDASRQQVLALKPVAYKKDGGGSVVTIEPLGAVLSPMRLVDDQPWRELVLDADGSDWLAPRSSMLAVDVLPLIAGVAEGRVETRTDLLAEWLGRERAVVVKHGLPEIGLQLVKVMPPELVYGHIPSLNALVVAAVLPMIMVWGAYRLDRMSQAAERLTTEVALSNQRRKLVEQRNHELSLEIERREQVERALKMSEERWVMAISGANDGIWDWRPQSGEMFYSGRWKRLLGYDADDIAPDIAEKERLIHPDDRDMVMRRLQKHLDGHTRFYQCEYRMRHKNGDYIWVLERGRALHDEHAQVVRVAGSLSDISERRRAEAQLKERSIQLNTIFEISPDGMVSFGLDRRVGYVNPAFLRMANLDMGDVHGISEAAFVRLMNDLCDEGFRFPGFAELQDHAPGQNSHALIGLRGPGKPMLDVKLVLSQGAGISGILFFRDVTVETEVDRMKSEFVSTAAHELRTPLASIYGYSEILAAESDSDSRQHMFAQTIHREAGMVASIIDELLDLARIESRRGADFVFERAELGALVAEVVAAYPYPAGRDKPDFRPPQRQCWVRVDKAKIRQCLNNILSNAYKYSPDGGIVEVELQYADGLCGVRVNDHGIGMTAQQLERIFERFYRADQSGAIPGTGLGLSIVKEIMELHGGHVSAQSRQGVGSEMGLWLPEKDAAAPDLTDESGSQGYGVALAGNRFGAANLSQGRGKVK
jgi:PAS domain S-box-containing protein